MATDTPPATAMPRTAPPPTVRPMATTTATAATLITTGRQATMDTVPDPLPVLLYDAPISVVADATLAG